MNFWTSRAFGALSFLSVNRSASVTGKCGISVFRFSRENFRASLVRNAHLSLTTCFTTLSVNRIWRITISSLIRSFYFLIVWKNSCGYFDEKTNRILHIFSFAIWIGHQVLTVENRYNVKTSVSFSYWLGA